MQASAPVSQESVFEFLASTRLPIVWRLASVTRLVALGLACASVAYGSFALFWWEDGLWNPALPWSGALPSLVSAPLYFLAWRNARGGRMQAAALRLFSALFLLSILATWDRGAFCAAWYLQPFLCLLATCCTGVVAGLAMTLVAVAALLLAAWKAPLGAPPEALPSVWLHAMSLSAVTLASALAGAILHKLVLSALIVAEEERREIADSRKALRYREKLLRHALRVETVGDLAGMVSHQLRNAYQVMSGHASLAEIGDASQRAEHLARIADVLRDSRPLLDELMGLAHPEEGKPCKLDLNEFCEKFHAKARRLLPSAIELSLSTSPRRLFVEVNPRGLEHALWNLVMNARHAIEDAGEIEISTVAFGDHAGLAVRDTGSGIPEDVKARIFDPYFTTKPPGQGTGLGLVAVERFVRSSKGRVDVESEPEKGATFRLLFPMLDPGERAESA
ncbi:MAG: hypothetical protein Fur0037_09310 [Planctomycetota bacterium]